MINLSKFIQNVILGGLILLIVSVSIVPNIGIANYKIFISKVIIGILFILWMFRILVLNESIVKNTLNIPLLVYFLLTVISYFLSDIKSASLNQAYKNFILIIFVFILINNIYSLKSLNYIINFWIISASLVALYGVFQVFGLDFFKQGRGVPCFSTFGNPNLLSSYLVVTLPISVAKFISSTNILKKIILFIFSVIFFLVTILTLSRSGIISLISAGVIFYFLFYKNKKPGAILSIKKLAWITAIFILIFVTLSFLIYSPIIKDKTDVLLSRELPRIYIWKATIQLIRENPFSGYGVGTFPVYFSKVIPLELLVYYPPSEQFVTHAHNEFLEILLEMGVIGLGVFLWIIIATLKSAFNILKFSKDADLHLITVGIITSVAVSLIFSMVNVSLRFIGVNLFFFLCIAIIVIIENIGCHESRSSL